MIRSLSVMSFLILVLASCEEKEMEVKDLADILPSSERDYTADASEELSDAEDSSNYFKQSFLAHGVLIDDLVRLESDAFPDRFNPKNSDRFQLRIEQDSIIYERWIYEDSSSLLNAYYNWLDCFGQDCESIKPGDQSRVSDQPMQLFVNDTTLILITGDVNADRWMKYHVSLGFEMNWRHVMQQSNYGKMTWSRYIDGEKIPVEPIQTLENEDNK